MSIKLPAAILSLLLWILLTFVVPVGLGVVHLLLGAGVLLMIRWWGERNDTGTP